MVTSKYREKIVQRPPCSPGPRRGSLKGSFPDPSLLGRRLPKKPTPLSWPQSSPRFLLRRQNSLDCHSLLLFYHTLTKMYAFECQIKKKL